MIELIQEALMLLKVAIDWALIVLVLGVVALVVLRWIILSVKPFGWASYYIRRATDPLIWPIAQMMPTSQNSAPLLLILGVLIGAFFFKWLTDDLVQALLGLLYGLSAGLPLQIIGWVFRLTEPIMGPFRDLVPSIGMLDLSPILLIFLLQFAQNAIVRIMGLRMMW
jgi:YggT family protein